MIQEEIETLRFPFSIYFLLRPLTPFPPLLVVKWDVEIISRNFNVVMDAIGPETDLHLKNMEKCDQFDYFKPMD